MSGDCLPTGQCGPDQVLGSHPSQGAYGIQLCITVRDCMGCVPHPGLTSRTESSTPCFGEPEPAKGTVLSRTKPWDAAPSLRRLWVHMHIVAHVQDQAQHALSSRSPSGHGMA